MRIEGGAGFPPQQGPAMYRAREGETLASVAQDFHLPADLLAKTNSLPLDAILKAGQELVIPEQTAQQSPAGIADTKDVMEPMGSGEGEHNYIGPGLNPYITIDAPETKHNYIGPEMSLGEHNYIGDTPAMGEHNYVGPEIPGRGGEVEALNYHGSEASPFLFECREGDTLASVADRLNVSEELLAKGNGFQPGATLLPGQKLLIPAKK